MVNKNPTSDNNLHIQFEPVVNLRSGKLFGLVASEPYSEQWLKIQGTGNKINIKEINKPLMVEPYIREVIAGYIEIAQGVCEHLIIKINAEDSAVDSIVLETLKQLIKEYQLSESALVVQFSGLECVDSPIETLNEFRKQGFQILFDNVNKYVYGLEYLLDRPPDYLSINMDSFPDLVSNQKQQVYLKYIVEIKKVLGITVLVQNVRNGQNLNFLNSIGVDLIQGEFISKPVRVGQSVDLNFKNKIGQAVFPDKRRNHLSDVELIKEKIETINPIFIDQTIFDVFDFFAKNKNINFAPIIYKDGQPAGIVSELSLKEYTYTTYGRSLIENKVYKKTISDFISDCPKIEISESVESILSAYSANANDFGIIITKKLKYLGILNAKSLLFIINHKNLSNARDQNPLTRMPGNNAILRYLDQVFNNIQEEYILVYFDFDYFKPFNDLYGFRQGDRAILMFAELMNKYLISRDSFLAHIGGDDFFAGFSSMDQSRAEEMVEQLLEQFRQDVQSIYNEKDRENACIVSTDREGNRKQFPLLGCSAAILRLSPDTQGRDYDRVMTCIADLKKQAKSKQNFPKVAIKDIGGCLNQGLM